AGPSNPLRWRASDHVASQPTLIERRTECCEPLRRWWVTAHQRAVRGRGGGHLTPGLAADRDPYQSVWRQPKALRAELEGAGRDRVRERGEHPRNLHRA